jgi:hypothetical protein
VQIPSSLYGFYKDVKSRCRKMVTSLARGQTWDEAVGAQDTIDTVDTSGLLVLHGPSRLLGGTPHFHCYLPLNHVLNAGSEGRLSPNIEDEVFEASLQTAWGVLGLLSQTNLMWVYPPERHQPILMACLQFWDTLDREGNRYTNGSDIGQRLWVEHTNIKYVLANMGVSADVLNSPLPTGGLAIVAMLAQEGNGKSH